MSFFESDYTPTDADLQDWIHVLKLNEAEDFAQEPEPGEDECFGDDKFYPYAPEYYPEYEYDDGWCDFEDNGEGFAC